MTRRPLGRTGLSIAPLVFGGNVFGWTADKPTSFDLLDRFLDAGFNAIDTADVYSYWAPGNVGGESETIIGEWLNSRGNRDKVVIITKVGNHFGPDRKGRLSAEYIERAVEGSLKRLQVETIDVYLSHILDPETPYAETLAAYEKLIKAGKVRTIGASNLDASQLKEALDVAKDNNLPRYEVLQPEYNLYNRAVFEGPLSELTTAEEIGVISFFALARGFLSGKYRSEADLGQSQRGGPIGTNYLNPRGFTILAALDAVAEKHGAKPAEVAIAWVIARKDITAPIASVTSGRQLESLIKAATLRLDGDDIAKLESASAPEA